jgi:hypothetical protein
MIFETLDKYAGINDDGSGRVLYMRLHAFPAYISRLPFRSVSAATTSVSVVVTPDSVDIGLYQGLYSS